MKLELTHSLKIRLLQALKDRVLDTDNFPELGKVEGYGSIPIEDWIKYRIEANAKRPQNND